MRSMLRVFFSVKSPGSGKEMRFFAFGDVERVFDVAFWIVHFIYN